MAERLLEGTSDTTYTSAWNIFSSNQAELILMFGSGQKGESMVLSTMNISFSILMIAWLSQTMQRKSLETKLESLFS